MILFPHIKTDKVLVGIIYSLMRVLGKSSKTAMMRGLKLILEDFMVSYDIPYKEDALTGTTTEQIKRIGGLNG